MVETLTFHLVAGADEAAFLYADRRVQTEVVPHHPGFLRRTTARGDQGEWLVVVLWRQEADAEASLRIAEEHDAQRGFMALVDPATVRSRRYKTLD